MAEETDDPVIRRMQFGERARQLREAAHISFSDAEQTLGAYDGQLSKIEHGRIAAKSDYVETMIREYGLTGAVADEFRELGVASRRRSAPKGVGARSRQYISLERAATEVRMVYNEIPGMVQTEDFAYAALSQSPMIAAADVSTSATGRARRSEAMFRDGGPRVWMVLGADALYREVGGPRVLRNQILRLREVADMENVSVRVVTWEAGACPALSCPFTLLYVDSRTIAYVESLTSPDYIRATDPYLAAFEHAFRVAENEDNSRVILDTRVSDLNKRI